ncbi:DNA-binding protein [Achromatium sp. WMS3]|nr:DNA-binding protein [Achromatium sp. WMS3]
MGKAFTEIADGLTNAIEHAKGHTTNIIEHTPERIDVQIIRNNMGMNQQKFCTTLGISINTLRNWEQGLRFPRGPAKVLLKIAQHNPQAITEIIK